MNDVHGAHGTTGVVKNPFLVAVEMRARGLLLQLGDDKVDDGARVVAVGGDGALRQFVQVRRVEDVELIQAGVEVAVETGEEGHQGDQEGETAHVEGGIGGGIGRRG